MAEELVEKAAHPVSIQRAPLYISRQPLYITNPTVFTPAQWRLTANEPVTALCIRHVIREIVALEWEITHDEPDENEATIKYLTRVLEGADDGDGFDTFVSRMLEDGMILPIGGNAELAPDDLTGMIGGLYHIDGATLYPTYDRDVPFVQINPYNGLDRVYFFKGDLGRLIFRPRVELARKMYQKAPVEDAFIAIESLSRIYVFNLKQLSDTPVAGLLDLLDMTEEEAAQWAVGYREMLDGIDPRKIALLYGHTKPARFVPFGATPESASVIENFKRNAELVTAAFGLSIGDLRIFEHERVRAGAEASQRVTARSGVGFYAQAIEDFFNSKVLFSSESGFKFKFKLGMTGEETQQAQLGQIRAQTLAVLTGNQPMLKPGDAQKQAEQWGIIDVELTGVPQAPGLEGLSGMLPQDSLDSMDQDTEDVNALADESTQPDALESIDQASDDMQQFVKALTTPNLQDRRSKTEIRFTRLLQYAFAQVGENINEEDINKLIQLIEPYQKSLVEKAGEKTAADKLDEMLLDADWFNLPDILDDVSAILKQAYTEGSLDTIDRVQEYGYKMGYTDSPIASNQTNFVLTNPRVIQLLEDHGTQLVQNVNNGTRFFLRQHILRGVKNNNSASDIVKSIKNNLFGLGKGEQKKLSDTRIKSIVNTELNWADSRSSLEQMIGIGIQTKTWKTRGYDVCPICVDNEVLGAVDMDYEYKTVFGEQTTLHPPAHPMTCHCYMDAPAEEFNQFFESGKPYWTGGALDKVLQEAVVSETARIVKENKKLSQKSLPMQKWGEPDLGVRSRFETVGDAQLWLGQFSLVPVVSDSDIDVKGGNYKYAGVVWGKDGDEYVEAALVDAERLPLDDIESGRATIFGAKGIRTTNVVKSDYDNSACIVIEIPQEDAEALNVDVDRPHLTLAFFNDISNPETFVPGTIGECINTAISKLPEEQFTIQTTGMVEHLGDATVVKVKPTEMLTKFWNDLRTELALKNQVIDKTHPEFLPHISLDYDTDITGYIPELARIIFPTRVLLLMDDKIVFEVSLRQEGYLEKSLSLFQRFANDIPANYRKDFEEFVRMRSSENPDDVEDARQMNEWYKDFLRTALVGGFDYYKDGTKPLMVRSVVKTDNGYQAVDADPVVKGHVCDDFDTDLLAAASYLHKIGYTIVPLAGNVAKTIFSKGSPEDMGLMLKAFYSGAGYSGVHDPDYDVPKGTGFFNRTNFERMKRSGEILLDGLHVRTSVVEDSAGDPITKMYDVATFNSNEELEKWLTKINAKPTGRNRYAITADDVANDKVWMK